MRITLLLSILAATGVSGFDVNWVPVDGDGPLPVSESYRGTLRKLCNLMEARKTIPPELLEKKDVIWKMCTKLRNDDPRGSREKNPTFAYAVAGLLGIGTLYMFWGYSRHLMSISVRSNSISDSEQFIREKRLNFFL